MSKQKYTVRVCYDLPNSQTLTVEADDPEHAMQLALDQADDKDFEASDTAFEPYIDAIVLGAHDSCFDAADNETIPVPIAYSSLGSMYSTGDLCLALFNCTLDYLRTTLALARERIEGDTPEKRCITPDSVIEPLRVLLAAVTPEEEPLEDDEA